VFGFHLLSSEASSLEDAAVARMSGDGALVDIRKAIDALLAQIDATPMPKAFNID
jgi:hypothetical protein